MSKTKTKTTIGLLCLLAALATGAATAESASAAALFGCKVVGASSLGQYTESHCATDAAHGSYTWTWAAESGATTDYCLLQTGGKYTDADCSAAGSGAFEIIELPNEPYFSLLGKSEGSELLHATIHSIKVEISCTKAQFSGQPWSRTLISLITLKLLSCSVKTPTGCTVGAPSEPNGTVSSNSLDGSLSGTEKIALEGRTSAAFFTLIFGGETCSLKGVKSEVTGTQVCSFGAGVSTPAAEHTITCVPSGSELKDEGSSAILKAAVALMFEPEELWWKIT
jgi:hypothetical protein